MEENKIFRMKERIKAKKDGLNFIKSIKIGIPYARLNLDVTIRKEVEVSFFHEITMKFIEKEWNNYDELCGVLGLDKDYMDNVLIELGRSDYIKHFGQQIYLTDKGKIALNNLKSIKIEPEFINNLYVNLMDGSLLLEPEKFKFNKSIKSKIFLNEKLNINMEFLVGIEDKIRDLYAENQKKDKLYRSSVDSKDELYRIISIQKHDFFYLEELVDIYISEDDNSFHFIFDSRNIKQDELYPTSLREQLRNNENSLKNMFDSWYFYQNNWQNEPIDLFLPIIDLQPFFKQRDKLEVLINEFSKNRLDEINGKIKNLYYSDRIMFFKEYKDYMLDLAQGYIRELYIITDHFYDLTGDGSMFSIIESAIKHSKVYIGFMDKGKNNFIKIIKENCGKSKNLYLSKYDNIKHTKIIVNNDYMITIYYKPIKVNNNVILEEVSMLTYNKEEIDMEIKHLKIKFEQDL